MDSQFLSPEDVQALSELGISSDRMDQLKEQFAQGRDMRYAPGPEGRRAGNTYVAANPFEHLGSAIEAYRGGKAMQGADAAMTQQSSQDAATRQAMMQRYMQMMQQPGANSLPPVEDPQTGAMMSPAPQRQQVMSQMLRGR